MRKEIDLTNVYRSQDVVDLYAKAVDLQESEVFLFKKYISVGLSVLDLGVGAGRTTPYLALGAVKYIGIDYSEEMISACRDRFPDQEFACLDAADLSQFADASFDVVVFSYNGMGHLTDEGRGACLDHIHRILRPAGHLLFSLHNARGLLLRPTRSGTGLAALARDLGRTLVENFKRLCDRLSKATFWRGSGYLWVGVHGGTWLFLSSPDPVRRELAAHRFTLLESLPDSFPKAAPSPLVRWWYYAARREPPSQ